MIERLCLSVLELREGNVYECRLSTLRMLAIKVATKEIKTMQGSEITEWQLQMKYYNPQTGGFHFIIPDNYQFMEL